MTTKIEATLFPAGEQFGANFFIRAIIEVTSFGTPETGAGYLADPDSYDPGSGAEWSVIGTPELHFDPEGAGERVTIGPKLAAALVDFITTDKAMEEQVDVIIAEHAKEGDEP